jgi:hypothetical protein
MLISVRSLLMFFRISRIQPQSPLPEAAEISALSGLMLLGFIGLLVSGFFISQGYSIFATLYFALAAAMARLQARNSVAVETTQGAAHTSEGYRGNRIPAKRGRS